MTAPSRGNDWKLVWTKTWRGYIVALAVSTLGYVAFVVKGLMEGASVPQWLGVLGPVILQTILMLSNIVKHSSWYQDWTEQ